MQARLAQLQGVLNSYLSIAAELGSVRLALFHLRVVAVAMSAVRSRGFQRQFAAVLLVTLLIGLLPRHWRYKKDTRIIFGLLLGHAASWRGLSGRSRARRGSAAIPAPR